jgi:ribosomal protein L24
VGKLRIGEYVSVVGGRHKGKYGIVEGTSNGKVEVRRRGMFYFYLE